MSAAATVSLILVGCFFFLAGTVGLLRLPDLFTRLHALAKADSLGLGFVALGLGLQAPNLMVMAKLVLIWLVAMISAATLAQLVAIHGRRHEGRTGDWE